MPECYLNKPENPSITNKQQLRYQQNNQTSMNTQYSTKIIEGVLKEKL